MRGRLAARLLRWLEDGRGLLGEIRISQNESIFTLCHYLDETGNCAEVFDFPEKAIELGKYDAAGKYRPLRTAPTLRRGWRLQLPSAQAAVEALDFFYPAMLGTAAAFEENFGQPTDLRDTLNRQTGMYRVAGKISNADADRLVGEVCAAKNCLKTNAWKIAADTPIQTLPPEKLDFALDSLGPRGGFIPMPCEECCNILVAAARETVKKIPSPPSTT